jgi:sugar/nucleoside kinase (ribokinase family)
MYDVTTIGTLTVDLYFKSENLTASDTRFELALDGKYFTDHFHESLGGGATNVAIGLQRQGLRTSLVTLIGNNSFKPLILEKLEKESVSFIHSKMAEEHLNISCILLSEKGEKTVINYQSPHQHLFSENDEFSFLNRTRAVYIANMPDVSFSEKLRLAKYLKQHEKQVIANFGVVDCRRPKEHLEELIRYVDVLIINGHEFADMVKTEYERLSFNRNIISFYFPDFKEKAFVVTEGKKGSYGYLNGKHFHQPSIPPAKIVDSTGAGDGFSVGFIAEYVKHGDIEKAMLSGAQYASKILGRIGAN